MKITDIELVMYNFEIDEAWDTKPEWHRDWHNAGTGWEYTATDRQECIVKVHTDEGITGIGSADKGHKDPRIVASVIEQLLKPILIGQNPLNIQRLWDVMWDRCGSMLTGTKGMGYGALGGIDVACWDILGKQLGAPIYQLLGGDPEIPIKPYIGTYTLGWRKLDDIDSIVDEAKFYVKEGYEAIKFRGGRGLPHLGDIETIKALRNEFSSEELTIVTDINGGYSQQQAYRMANEFEKYDLFWIEDPFKTRNYAKYAALQAKTNINIFIGGGPSSLDLARMIDSGSTTNLASICTEHAGGITEAMKVAALINSWDMKAAAIAHEPLGSLATFHVWQAVSENITQGSWVEYDPHNSCWDKLMTDPPKFKNKRLVLSDKPGLGTDLNERFLEEHPLPDVVSRQQPIIQ